MAPNPQLFSFYLAALREMGRALATDARRVRQQRPLRDSLYRMLGTFAVGKGLLLVHDAETSLLELAASKAMRTQAAPLPLALTRNERLALSRGTHPFHPQMPPGGLERLPDKLAPLLGPLLARDQVRWVVVLATGSQFIGLALLGERLSGQPFTSLELEVLEEMATVLALRLEDARARRELDERLKQLQKQSRQLKQIYVETVRALAGAIDGPETDGRPGHSVRVAALASEMGRRLKLNGATCERLYMAGLLHDIGKQIISREVLEKRTPLGDDERRTVESHPTLACDLISHLRFPWGDVATIIRHHHERLDGKGYPDRLRGDQISIEAKVLMVAEAFDSMTSDQPWRPRLSPEHVGEQISKNLGLQFEPRVVQALCEAVTAGLDGQARQAEFVPHLEASFDPGLIKSMLGELRRQLAHPTLRPSANIETIGGSA